MRAAVISNVFMLASALAVLPPSSAHADTKPLYASGRLSLGFAGFDYAGTSESDGGSTISYPAQTASGPVLGVGGTFAKRVGANIYLGGTFSFDPLLSATDNDGDSGFMPNGTIGGAFIWLPKDTVVIESALAVGGGGGAMLPGGIGLHLQLAARLDLWRGNEEMRFGPIARVTYGALMVDPSRGGGVSYYSFDLGIGIAAY